MSCFSYLTSYYLLSKPSHVMSLRVLATCSKTFIKTPLLELSSVVLTCLGVFGFGVFCYFDFLLLHLWRSLEDLDLVM